MSEKSTIYQTVILNYLLSMLISLTLGPSAMLKAHENWIKHKIKTISDLISLYHTFKVKSKIRRFRREIRMCKVLLECRTEGLLLCFKVDDVWSQLWRKFARKQALLKKLDFSSGLRWQKQWGFSIVVSDTLSTIR